MYPIVILEWLYRGVWREIGWRATTPAAAEDLRKHGQALADAGVGRYRLSRLDAFRGQPNAVIHEFQGGFNE